MKKILLTLTLIAFVLETFSWGTDVMVGPQATGKATLVSTSNGILYCSIPAGTTGVGGLRIYTSTDMGLTWVEVASIPGLPPTKSKLVITGTDSVYCVYKIGTDIFTFSIAANVSTPFTTIQADDFDAAASPNSNSIYLYAIQAGSNDLRRYSSTDGGYTWTGSTALVAGDAARPSVYMEGTRLILNYYGPVSPDTATSIIRTAIYDETSPGQLTSSNFQDLVTNTLHHREYSSVKSGSHVWFFYTEGNTSQTLNYMLSTNGGVSYGTPVTISGTANVSVSCFDACHYSDPTGDGARLVYYADSMGVRQMMCRSTSTISSGFSPEQSFNDYTPECFAGGGQPSVSPIGVADAGVIWQQDSSSFLSTYFDKQSATVGIEQLAFDKSFLIYPNPTSTIIKIESASQDVAKITDLSGREMQLVNLFNGINEVDISTFPSGMYYVTGSGGYKGRFVKMD